MYIVSVMQPLLDAIYTLVDREMLYTAAALTRLLLLLSADGSYLCNNTTCKAGLRCASTRRLLKRTFGFIVAIAKYLGWPRPIEISV